MSNFVGVERLEIGIFTDPTTGKKTWVTSKAYGFVLGGNINSVSQDVEPFVVITVDEYFETDLGSIPRWLRWLFNPADPRYARAFVTHDWMNKLTARRPPGLGVWSSQIACGVLYDALRLDGASVLASVVLVAGVFLGIAKAER